MNHLQPKYVEKVKSWCVLILPKTVHLLLLLSFIFSAGVNSAVITGFLSSVSPYQI